MFFSSVPWWNRFELHREWDFNSQTSTAPALAYPAFLGCGDGGGFTPVPCSRPCLAWSLPLHDIAYIVVLQDKVLWSRVTLFIGLVFLKGVFKFFPSANSSFRCAWLCPLRVYNVGCSLFVTGYYNKKSNTSILIILHAEVYGGCHTGAEATAPATVGKSVAVC